MMKQTGLKYQVQDDYAPCTRARTGSSLSWFQSRGSAPTLLMSVDSAVPGHRKDRRPGARPWLPHLGYVQGEGQGLPVTALSG